jgi:hypothetical protein
MVFRTAFAVLAAAACLAAANKKTTGAGRGENQDVLLNITVYTAPASIKELIGDDLGGHYIVASVKLQSKYGKEIAVDRDDFVLRSDKDGEKTKPFAASQIAGRGALVVSQTGRGGAVGAEQGGPIIGGIPGTMGGPMRLPGSSGSVGSGGMGDGGGAEAKVDSGNREKDNPLLQRLKDKILPEKKTDSTVEGLLYFPMEKQKLKDLELTYGGRENRITMRFK